MAKKLDEEVELLRRIPIFAKIEPARLKLLAFTSERVTYEPGQEICRQGDIGDAAYLVISGEAGILVDTPTGPLQIAEVSKNALVGEIAHRNGQGEHQGRGAQNHQGPFPAPGGGIPADRDRDHAGAGNAPQPHQ